MRHNPDILSMPLGKLGEQLSPEALTLSSGCLVKVQKRLLCFTPWRGPSIRDTFGNKAVLDFHGKPLFAELVILRLLQEAGWKGVWVDSYRRAFRRSLPPSRCALPPGAQNLFDKIVRANGGRSGGCWDIFAWKGRLYLFVESKRRRRDSIRATQINWYESARKVGVRANSFLILEWEVKE